MTTSPVDAKTLAELVFSQPEAARLKTAKILAHVYDGAPMMSRQKCRVQRLLKRKRKDGDPIHTLFHLSVSFGCGTLHFGRKRRIGFF